MRKLGFVIIAHLHCMAGIPIRIDNFPTVPHCPWIFRRPNLFTPGLYIVAFKIAQTTTKTL